jgi:phospholipase/lecithinase/hemolysin
MMKDLQTKFLALAVSLLVAGCGGGSTANITPLTKITAVKVFGDSLADSGTFGFKFTVQAVDNQIYPERVAATYGLSLCNFYVFTGTTFAANPKAGCTNYAIGGAVINHSSPVNPLGIPLQFANAVAAGNYAATDLALIDGGGNDASDLVGAYLKAPYDGGASLAALLGTKLTPTQVGTALAGGPSGIAAGGVTYMQALADYFSNSIKTNVIGKGAMQVAILNMPGITNTPRFQMVLDSIAAGYGGGTAGAAARAQSDALFKSWVVAFNTQLSANFASESKVAIIDFYTSFNDQIATPAQFSLSNVKTPACPIVGLGSDGLPVYSFPTCTSASLSAAITAGSTDPNWWKSYAFSDGFHPTPYGHQLVAQLISKSLAIKGWL